MTRLTPTVFLALATLAGVAAWAATTGNATLPSPTVQQRIDALLKHRLKPEPLPVTPPNPFQTQGTARLSTDELASKPAVADEGPTPATGPGTSDPTQPRETPGASHSEVLIGCAQRLKLGGIIVLKEQIQIVVNGVPRKEGDMIAADWNNTIVYLRIARLLPGHMVLRYGDAEATMKF